MVPCVSAGIVRRRGQAAGREPLLPVRLAFEVGAMAAGAVLAVDSPPLCKHGFLRAAAPAYEEGCEKCRQAAETSRHECHTCYGDCAPAVGRCPAEWDAAPIIHETVPRGQTLRV